MRLAAENVSEEDIAVLRRLFARCNEASKQTDMEEFSFDNLDFHFALATASHNMLYIKLMRMIRQMTVPIMRDFLNDQGADIDSTFYHGMILQCVVEHKPEEAAFFMQRHMSLVVDRVRGYVGRQDPRKES